MVIPDSVLADIFAHARAEAPRECCGLLVGAAATVVRSVRARNLGEGNARYLVDPEDHFKAIRAARADALEIIGAYHSHPCSPPVPSPTDIAEAHGGPEFLYLIVSLLNAEARGYRIDEGLCVDVGLYVSPGTGEGI